ncbi:MAG: phosphodiester glycosidase family protein [Desulforhabdus sp.]|nr:phosphodiester glycosidase family protein [Desulforhabdus sp.]
MDDGLFLGELVGQNESDQNPLKITILKIDPAKHSFSLLCASELKGEKLTIKERAQKFNLIAAINAGMYQTDELTSVGYMKNFNHVNNPKVNGYKAVLAFNRIDQSVPPIQIIDRECQDYAALRSKYRTLFQGIRMISCEGKNVWKQQPDKWSTAAVGIDKEGNALFIFCQTPSSVHDLINVLLALPISIHNAMYLEGGPPASFYLVDAGVELKLQGFPNFDFTGPIPNVLGVAAK